MLLPSFLLSLSLICFCRASVTVYGQHPYGDSTATASNAAQYTAAAVYDPTVLTPPAVPSPAPPTQFSIPLQSNPSNVQGLSIAQRGSFMGFSIEFSVINQILGINSSFLQVPFLNLMSNLVQRGGSVHIRVGGNTQDYATLVDSLADGKMIEKQNTGNNNPTETPTLLYTPEVFYLLGNISALLDVRWYLGIPLNDTSNLRLQIAEVGEAVLGDKLLGLQVGNEPDLYSAHGHRSSTYGPSDYYGDFAILVNAVNADANIPTKNNLIAPSLAGVWTPEEVWDTNFIPTYTGSLGALAVEHYPNDNCYAQYGVGSPVVPQDVFGNYTNHAAGQNIVQPYLNSTSIAQAAGKPFLMFETNTASCGGFPGISDSFGATLWALDYGLQMAYSNFSGAMLHVGGQNVYYNPFTPPPTNESSYHQWTIGAIFYATLAIAETLGTSNTSQLMDLQANNNNIYTPAYVIYESGAAARLALFNYVTDTTGASTYTATFSLGGGSTGEASSMPASVQVKYLVAPSVSEKYNITWAGQTFGGTFASDGRLQGEQDVKTINCDQTANTCQVQVPAPGFALVFLSSAAFSESNPSTTQTFPTTALTKSGDIQINQAVLATSNGHSGSTWKLASTSKGSWNGAQSVAIPSVVMIIAMVLGAIVSRKTLI